MIGRPLWHSCRWDSSRTSRLMLPSILLLLAEKPSYGYELMEGLAELGFYESSPDPGATYRILRHLEAAGLVESEWDTWGTGPARRYYRLTPVGYEILDGWSAHMRQREKAIRAFLDRYDKRCKARR